jgi:uncharacterized protein YdeI (YjbR/CyaY-like superfamily)
VVKVVLQRDDSKRSMRLPEELVRGLKQNKHAGATFKTLKYSQKKEYADWIATAKQAVTKASRFAKAVELPASGQRRLR